MIVNENKRHPISEHTNMGENIAIVIGMNVEMEPILYPS